MPTYLSPGVYVEEVDSGSRPIEGVGTAVAAFVGIAERGPFDEPTLVTNWSQFTSLFGDFVEGTYLAHAVYGFFMNGGGACYVVRVGRDDMTPAAAAALPAAANGKDGAQPRSYRIQAIEAGPAGNDLAVEVVDTGTPGPPAAGDDKAGETKPQDQPFKLVVRRGDTVVEEFDNLTARRGRQNVRTVVNAQSRLIRLDDAGGSVALPARGAVRLSGGGAGAPARVQPAHYVGDVVERTGLGGLEAVDAVTMVAVPDLMGAYQEGTIDLDGVHAVQRAMIAHCESMGDRVAIIDPPPGLNAQQVRDWRLSQAGHDSRHAALYWPWIKVFDPAGAGGTLVPPSGHVAGIWGRNDDARGVHKAPANEVVRGAVGLQLQITRREHDMLNPHGINCVRAFPGRGIRVWGARTLSSDPAWTYLNVRRLFNYLEESILAGTQWVVFEPNDPALWAKIRRTISSFLTLEWRKGALFGLNPDEAFYVKCDGETNTPESIDAGQVICEIGVAPVKPAEFVVFRLSQYAGGPSVVTE